MKTKTCQQLILITVFTLFIMTLSAAGNAAEYVSVKKDGVNIRSGPSTDDKITWQVFESFPLQILERQGKWAHVVDFEGDKGWIYDTLISSKKTVIVTVETANMRGDSSTDSPVIVRPPSFDLILGICQPERDPYSGTLGTDTYRTPSWVYSLPISGFGPSSLPHM